MDTKSLIAVLIDVGQDIAESKIIEAMDKYSIESSPSISDRTLMASSVPAASLLLTAASHLESGCVSKYGSVRRSKIKQLGLLESSGPSLGVAVRGAVDGKTLASTARASIATLREQTDRLRGDVQAAVKALKNVGVSIANNESLGFGCIVKMQVIGIELDIDEISSKFHKWDLHLQMLSEIATGSKSSKSVRSIEPGSIELTLVIDGYAEAALIAIAVGYVYKARLAAVAATAAKSLMKGHEGLGEVPGVLEAASEKILDEHKRLAKNVITEMIPESSRKPELKTSASMAVDFIFEQTTQGDQVEVVIGNIESEQNLNQSDTERGLMTEKSAIEHISKANKLAAEYEIKEPKRVDQLPEVAGE